MVISMVPGLTLGIQSNPIDYDAVAYRTSVILVEDPGSPSNPPWLLIDDMHKDDILRLGLAASGETPNVLSREKVDLFFNQGANLTFTPDDYREKAIFGDIPYAYNFSLMPEGGTAMMTGEQIPRYTYGYMKRIVKIKEPGFADVNCSAYSYNKGPFSGSSQNYSVEDLSVRFDYNLLFNRSISPAYRSDPRQDIISFSIRNITEYLEPFNPGDLLTVNLTQVRFYREGAGYLPYDYSVFDNKTYTLENETAHLTLDERVPITQGSVLNMTLYPPLPVSSDTSAIILVNFTFRYDYNPDITADHYNVSGVHNYNYDPALVRQPRLTPAVLEVAIW